MFDQVKIICLLRPDHGVSLPKLRLLASDDIGHDSTTAGRMSTSPPHRPLSNRGGGCVEQFRIIPAPPNQHMLELRAPVGVADQLELLEPRYAGTMKQRGANLVIRGPGLDLTAEAKDLLDALTGVLTLPCAAGVDYALALDWTKQPIDGLDARSWPNTRIGDLVHRGKYWYKGSQQIDELREVGQSLTTELCNLIDRHVLLRAADTIIAVPGHDARVLSFGARLASSVAYRRSVRFVAARSASAFRTPAKSLDLTARAAVINKQFRCDANLTDHKVLVLDDLYSSGTTAAETARAARAAGASRVAVLCAVRTMRSR